MNEHFVAINRQSLYPEIREADNTMREVVVTKTKPDGEPRVPRTDGETRHKGVEAKRQEHKRAKEEEERRRRKLEREGQEAEVSTRETREQVRKAKEAVEALKKAARSAEAVSQVSQPSPAPEEPPIVVTPKRLAFLPRDEVNQIFKSQSVE